MLSLKGIDMPWPKHKETDIDVFDFLENIPGYMQRKSGIARQEQLKTLQKHGRVIREARERGVGLRRLAAEYQVPIFLMSSFLGEGL